MSIPELPLQARIIFSAALSVPHPASSTVYTIIAECIIDHWQTHGASGEPLEPPCYQGQSCWQLKVNKDTPPGEGELFFNGVHTGMSFIKDEDV